MNHKKLIEKIGTTLTNWKSSPSNAFAINAFIAVISTVIADAIAQWFGIYARTGEFDFWKICEQIDLKGQTFQVAQVALVISPLTTWFIEYFTESFWGDRGGFSNLGKTIFQMGWGVVPTIAVQVAVASSSSLLADEPPTTTMVRSLETLSAGILISLIWNLKIVNAPGNSPEVKYPLLTVKDVGVAILRAVMFLAPIPLTFYLGDAVLRIPELSPVVKIALALIILTVLAWLVLPNLLPKLPLIGDRLSKSKLKLISLFVLMPFVVAFISLPISGKWIVDRTVETFFVATQDTLPIVSKIIAWTIDLKAIYVLLLLINIVALFLVASKKGTGIFSLLVERLRTHWRSIVIATGFWLASLFHSNNLSILAWNILALTTFLAIVGDMSPIAAIVKPIKRRQEASLSQKSEVRSQKLEIRSFRGRRQKAEGRGQEANFSVGDLKPKGVINKSRSLVYSLFLASYIVSSGILLVLAIFSLYASPLSNLNVFAAVTSIVFVFLFWDSHNQSKSLFKTNRSLWGALIILTVTAIGAWLAYNYSNSIVSVMLVASVGLWLSLNLPFLWLMMRDKPEAAIEEAISIPSKGNWKIFALLKFLLTVFPVILLLASITGRTRILQAGLDAFVKTIFPGFHKGFRNAVFDTGPNRNFADRPTEITPELLQKAEKYFDNNRGLVLSGRRLPQELAIEKKQGYQPVGMLKQKYRSLELKPNSSNLKAKEMAAFNANSHPSQPDFYYLETRSGQSGKLIWQNLSDRTLETYPLLRIDVSKTPYGADGRANVTAKVKLKNGQIINIPLGLLNFGYDKSGFNQFDLLGSILQKQIYFDRLDSVDIEIELKNPNPNKAAYLSLRPSLETGNAEFWQKRHMDLSFEDLESFLRDKNISFNFFMRVLLELQYGYDANSGGFLARWNRYVQLDAGSLFLDPTPLNIEEIEQILKTTELKKLEEYVDRAKLILQTDGWLEDSVLGQFWQIDRDSYEPRIFRLEWQKLSQKPNDRTLAISYNPNDVKTQKNWGPSFGLLNPNYYLKTETDIDRFRSIVKISDRGFDEALLKTFDNGDRNSELVQIARDLEGRRQEAGGRRQEAEGFSKAEGRGQKAEVLVKDESSNPRTSKKDIPSPTPDTRHPTPLQNLEEKKLGNLLKEIDARQNRSDVKKQEALKRKIFPFVKPKLLEKYNGAILEAIVSKYKFDIVGFYGYGDRLQKTLMAQMTGQPLPTPELPLLLEELNYQLDLLGYRPLEIVDLIRIIQEDTGLNLTEEKDPYSVYHGNKLENLDNLDHLTYFFQKFNTPEELISFIRYKHSSYLGRKREAFQDKGQGERGRENFQIQTLPLPLHLRTSASQTPTLELPKSQPEYRIMLAILSNPELSRHLEEKNCIEKQDFTVDSSANDDDKSLLPSASCLLPPQKIDEIIEVLDAAKITIDNGFQSDKPVSRSRLERTIQLASRYHNPEITSNETLMRSMLFEGNYELILQVMENRGLLKIDGISDRQNALTGLKKMAQLKGQYVYKLPKVLGGGSPGAEIAPKIKEAERERKLPDFGGENLFTEKFDRFYNWYNHSKDLKPTPISIEEFFLTFPRKQLSGREVLSAIAEYNSLAKNSATLEDFKQTVLNRPELNDEKLLANYKPQELLPKNVYDRLTLPKQSGGLGWDDRRLVRTMDFVLKRYSTTGNLEGVVSYLRQIADGQELEETRLASYQPSVGLQEQPQLKEPEFEATKIDLIKTIAPILTEAGGRRQEAGGFSKAEGRRQKAEGFSKANGAKIDRKLLNSGRLRLEGTSSKLRSGTVEIPLKIDSEVDRNTHLQLNLDKVSEKTSLSLQLFNPAIAKQVELEETEKFKKEHPEYTNYLRAISDRLAESLLWDEFVEKKYGQNRPREETLIGRLERESKIAIEQYLKKPEIKNLKLYRNRGFEGVLQIPPPGSNSYQKLSSQTLKNRSDWFYQTLYNVYRNSSESPQNYMPYEQWLGIGIKTQDANLRKETFALIQIWNEIIDPVNRELEQMLSIQPYSPEFQQIKGLSTENLSAIQSDRTIPQDTRDNLLQIDARRKQEKQKLIQDYAKIRASVDRQMIEIMNTSENSERFRYYQQQKQIHDADEEKLQRYLNLKSDQKQYKLLPPDTQKAIDLVKAIPAFRYYELLNSIQRQKHGTFSAFYSRQPLDYGAAIDFIKDRPMQALREKLEARIASRAKPNPETGWGGYVRNLPIEIQRGSWTHNLALEPYRDWLGQYVNKGNKRVWVANPIALKLHLNSTVTKPGNQNKYVEFTDIPKIVGLNLTKTSSDVIDLSDSGQGKAGSEDLVHPWEGDLQISQIRDDRDRIIPGQIKLTRSQSKTAGNASRTFSVDRSGDYEIAFKLHSLSPDTEVYLDVRERETKTSSQKDLPSFDETKKISLDGVPASTTGQTYSYKMRLEAGKLYRLNAILDRSNNIQREQATGKREQFDRQSAVVSINARRILRGEEYQNIAIPLSDREYQRQPLMNWNWEKKGGFLRQGAGVRGQGENKEFLTITGEKNHKNSYASAIRKIQIPTTNNLVRVDVGDVSATSNAQINILPGGDDGDAWMSQFPKDSKGNYLPIATATIKNGQSSTVFAIDRQWMQKSGGKLRLQIVLTGGYRGVGLSPGSVAGRSLEVLGINFMTQAELNRRHPNIQLVTSKQPIDITAVQSYQVQKNSTSSNTKEPIALGKGTLQRRYYPGDRGQIVTQEGIVVKQMGINIPTGWNNWWQQVTPEHWQAVLDDVGSLGLNHVRIFVPFVPKNGQVASTSISSVNYLRQMQYLDKLKQFVEDAERKGISVTVTLFDLDRSLPQQINPNDPLYQEQVNYLSRIVETLKDSKYVIYDLQNEPDLHAKDLPRSEVDRLRQWLKAMAVELRNLDGDRHLIFLGTGSIEAMDRTGFLKDLELLKVLDGITLHTGSINEAIAPQIKALDRLIKDNQLGLIVKWGEFGDSNINTKIGANYVKDAVMQIQRYDLAGGDFWQYYATGLDGQPMRNEKGEVHSSWGIQDKPEIRLALQEASKNFVTSIQNPIARWRSLLAFQVKPDTTPVNLPFPNLPSQNNHRVSIKRKEDTLMVMGTGMGDAIYGEAISEPISTDLDREQLVLNLNVSKLSGLYYLQVKVGDRYVYLVRDSATQGDRELPLSEVLMAMGLKGKVDNVNIAIGLVNTMTGAKTTAGAFAEMKMSIAKTPGNYLLKQLPGSIAANNPEKGSKLPWQFDIGAVQTLYDDGTKTGASATEVFNPNNHQNYQLIQSTGDRGVKEGRRQEAGGRRKLRQNLDSDRIHFAPMPVSDRSETQSNSDGGYGTVIRQISVETPANRGEELDKKLLIWVEDMSTLNEAYLNINVSPHKESDRQRFSHPFKIPLSKGLNEIDFTTAKDDRGYSLKERLNSAKDIQGKYNFSLEYVLATGQPEISSENSFLIYQAKFVDAKNKRGHDNRSAVAAFARQHAPTHIKKINSTCDPRTKYLVVAGDWRMHSLFAREGWLKKSADTLQFNQRHIIIPEYDVAAVGNSRGYNSMKQLIRMLENNDRYHLDTVMTSDPYYKFLLAATGWQPAEDDLTNVSTEVNDMLPASPTVWHKPAQAMSVNELAPEVRNQLGLEFKASQSDRELKAAMAELLVQGNNGDERLPAKVRLLGKGIWSIYTNAGGLLGLTILAVLVYLLLRSRSTERFLAKVLSIRKRNIILLYLGFLAAHMTIRQWNYIWDWNTYRVQIANPAKETRYSGQSPYFSGTEGNYNPLPFWTLDLLENLHDEVTGTSSLGDRVKPCDINNSDTVVTKGIVETNFAKLHNRLFSQAIDDLKSR